MDIKCKTCGTQLNPILTPNKEGKRGIVRTGLVYCPNCLKIYKLRIELGG